MSMDMATSESSMIRPETPSPGVKSADHQQKPKQYTIPNGRTLAVHSSPTPRGDHDPSPCNKPDMTITPLALRQVRSLASMGVSLLGRTLAIIIQAMNTPEIIGSIPNGKETLLLLLILLNQFRRTESAQDIAKLQKDIDETSNRLKAINQTLSDAATENCTSWDRQGLSGVLDREEDALFRIANKDRNLHDSNYTIALEVNAAQEELQTLLKRKEYLESTLASCSTNSSTNIPQYSDYAEYSDYDVEDSDNASDIDHLKGSEYSDYAEYVEYTEDPGYSSTSVSDSNILPTTTNSNPDSYSAVLITVIASIVIAILTLYTVYKVYSRRNGNNEQPSVRSPAQADRHRLLTPEPDQQTREIDSMVTEAQTQSPEILESLV